MTEPTRGARLRRGGRRPGWVLMTVLLVLAILASSALVFTNRVELLKLAVILALWAAVVAAFVSVIYRRQSDTDQAKVRDLKHVYDLQLDREIAARREYELAVESHLRRELSAELRAQQSDEVAALRAELAALRANLEYLFDADLAHRHAIEGDRSRQAGPWTPRADTAGRISSSRLDAEEVSDVVARRVESHIESHTDENPIIDVSAEPHPPEEVPSFRESSGVHSRAAEEPPRRHRADSGAPADRGRAESAGRAGHHADAAQRRWAPPPPEPAAAESQFSWLPPASAPPPGSPPQPRAKEPPPPRVAEPAPPRAAEPPPAPRTPEPPPSPRPAPERAASSAGQWQPAAEEDRWSAGGASAGRRQPASSNGAPGEYVGRRRAPEPRQEPAPEVPRGRHTVAGDAPPAPAPAPPPPEPDEQESAGAHTGGQSVADLMARLQVAPSGGGRRRRRDD